MALYGLMNICPICNIIKTHLEDIVRQEISGSHATRKGF